jgi:signal transduction histidine kinase
MMHDWPIARRLTAMVVLVSGIVLLLTSAAFAGYQYWSFRTSARDRLAVRAQIIAANSTASLAFSDEESAREILSGLRADPHVVSAALFDADGRPFATFQREGSEATMPSTPGSDGYRFEGGLLVGYEPVAQTSDARLGTLYIASDLSALYDSFLLSGLIGMIVFAVSLLAAYGLSLVFQRTISRPILELAETASAFSGGRDYSVRAPRVAGGELGELTDALNHMLAHIEEQDRQLRLSKDELEAHATELEQRVAERTQDLEHINEALEHKAASLSVANAELDAFAYSVSHDLRAPLRSIDGFSQVVLEDYADKLDADGQDALKRVRAASQRMGSLIDNLLRLARISRVEMRTETVDLSGMAERIAAELQRTAPERDVEFVIEPDLKARGDARLLEVAVENLLNNSWKYTSKRDRARIELRTTRTNGKRTFVVRDNGAGFDMAYADKLFGEFKRLHSDSEFEGTGVGLATVRRIITRHGGAIWAEGAVDEGATFYFTLGAPRSKTKESTS